MFNEYKRHCFETRKELPVAESLYCSYYVLFVYPVLPIAPSTRSKVFTNKLHFLFFPSHSQAKG